MNKGEIIEKNKNSSLEKYRNEIFNSIEKNKNCLFMDRELQNDLEILKTAHRVVSDQFMVKVVNKLCVTFFIIAAIIGMINPYIGMWAVMLDAVTLMAVTHTTSMRDKNYEEYKKNSWDHPIYSDLLCNDMKTLEKMIEDIESKIKLNQENIIQCNENINKSIHSCSIVYATSSYEIETITDINEKHSGCNIPPLSLKELKRYRQLLVGTDVYSPCINKNDLEKQKINIKK